MELTIELPGIKAVSRNQTAGHYFKYRKELINAEKWTKIFAKAKEYHFTKPVDVYIIAYYKMKGRLKCADTPNIDDKIFTDILNRYKPQKKGSKLERSVWFIEDDSPVYLRYVIKRAIPSDQFKVVITIKEVENAS